MILRTLLHSVVAAVMFLAPLAARATGEADSAAVAVPPVESCPGCEFRPAQLILPASLIAVGTFGVYNHGFKRMNRWVKDVMDDLRGMRHIRIDDYIQYLPAAAYLGLGFVGVKARHPFRERLVAGATAYLAMTAIVNAAKYTVREPRPDSGQRNSFPSGHTATVFTGAELVREEYGLWPGVGAYTVATGVAFLRLYNGRHWLNDVIAGAGIGILSARIGYWMLPLWRRWFGWDKSPSAPVVAVAPGYSRFDNSFFVGMSVTF